MIPQTAPDVQLRGHPVRQIVGADLKSTERIRQLPAFHEGELNFLLAFHQHELNRHLDRYAELLPRPETTPVDEHGPVASTNKIPV